MSTSRRTALKQLGLRALGTTLGGQAFGRPVDRTRYLETQSLQPLVLDKPIRAITCGAGNRPS